MSAKKLPDKDFSRPLLVDRVPRKGSHEVIKADPAECAVLARRFDLPNLFTLNAHFVVTPWRGGGLKVTGSVDADVEQRSVVSLEIFRHAARFAVERYFLAAKNIAENADVDADPIVNGEIDLGAIAAETLGLELDPYPRKPGESFFLPTTEG
jgi:hypothetical protein